MEKKKKKASEPEQGLWQRWNIEIFKMLVFFLLSNKERKSSGGF